MPPFHGRWQGSAGLLGESGLQVSLTGEQLTTIVREVSARTTSEAAVLLVITHRSLAALDPDEAARLRRCAHLVATPAPCLLAGPVPTPTLAPLPLCPLVVS